LKSLKHTKDQIKLVSDELNLAKKQLVYQVEKDVIKNAVELTKYYIEYIMPEIDSYVAQVAGSKYSKEIGKLDFKLFFNFNQAELFEIIQLNHNCQQPRDVFDMINNIEKCMKEDLSKTIVMEKDGKRIELNSMPINAFLNKIEYFCMNFITKVADEETIYRAIHQTFLANIRHLYFPIALKNYSS